MNMRRLKPKYNCFSFRPITGLLKKLFYKFQMLTKLCTDEKKYSILIGSNKERPVMYKMFQLQDCIFISHDVPCTDD